MTVAAQQLQAMLRHLPAWHARTWFLLLALPVGLFIALGLPPFQGLDEINHFYRAYTITDGALLPARHDGRAGGWMPACVFSYVDFQWRPAERPMAYDPSTFLRQPQPCVPGRQSFVPFENTAFYPPVPYLPQSLAIAIAKGLGAPMPVLFYAGRLGALLSYLALVSLALTVSPRGRGVMLAVALMPMSLLGASIYSADGMTLALSLLTVATVLRCVVDPEATGKTIGLAFLAALGLALTKSTYVALAPLLILIPSRLFRSRRLGLAVKLGAIGVIGLVSVAWYLQIRDITLAPWFRPGEINPQVQLHHAMQHPLGYAKLIGRALFDPPVASFGWNTFIAQVGFFRPESFGVPFPPPAITALGFLVLLQAYVVELFGSYKWSKEVVVRAGFPLVLVALNVVLVISAIYIQSTPVRSPDVTVPGRYFLPLAAVPLVSIAFLSRTRSFERATAAAAVLLLPVYAWLALKIKSTFY